MSKPEIQYIQYLTIVALIGVIMILWMWNPVKDNSLYWTVRETNGRVHKVKATEQELKVLVDYKIRQERLVKK